MEWRMMEITSSVLSHTILRPSRMCSRSLAFFRSNWVRRVTTWNWNFRYSSSISFKVKTRGMPSTRQSIITPTVS